MRQAALLMGVLLLPLLVSGCSNKQEQNVPRTRGIGEECDDTSNLCVDGLYCDNGKCREMCDENAPCGKGEKCIDNRCLPWRNNEPGDNTDGPGDNTDGPGDNTDGPGDNTDEPGFTGKIVMPQGGTLTNVAGRAKTSDGKYEVHILGGGMSGGSKGSNDSQIQVNEGSWK